MLTPDRAGRFDVDSTASAAANRRWWDAEADQYLAEHGDFLGDADFVWGPEGWTEGELAVLGDVPGRRVLEFGAGAGQAGRWCTAQGADVVATDLSFGMLQAGQQLNAQTGLEPTLLQCDAQAVPFADASFDIVFSAFGAVPFVQDSAGLMRELARVVRPGGLVAFSTSHPIRWAFPDAPGEAGLTISQSYFDTTPYAEATGESVTYVEHHRTLAERINEVVAAGLHIHQVLEPEWKASNEQIWGGWSPQRGRLIPGSLIISAKKPAE